MGGAAGDPVGTACGKLSPVGRAQVSQALVRHPLGWLTRLLALMSLLPLLALLATPAAWAQPETPWPQDLPPGAQQIDLPWEVSPADNGPARRTTTAWWAIVDRALWLRVSAQEPRPDELRARRRPRDEIDGDDAVGLLLAPDGVRGAEAFYFWVSAAGVQYDAHYTESGQQEDSSWDARWQSRVLPYAWLSPTSKVDGYTVDLRIPLAQLPLAAQAQQTWGIEIQRAWPREADARLSSVKALRDRDCTLCRFSPVAVQLPDGAQWRELDGALVLLASRQRSDSRDGLTDTHSAQRQQQVGLDLGWRPLRGLSLALTLNPDFSQVESDEVRLSANSADVFDSTERRPFFVQAGQPFNQLLRPLYTRNLGDPDAAIAARFNFTGGDLALLAARDARTQRLLPGTDGSSLDELKGPAGQALGSDNLALRYRQQVPGGGLLGASLTARHADGYANRVAGLDLSQPLVTGLNLEAAWLGSRSRLGDTRLAGQSALLRLAQRSGDWSSQAGAERTSAGFRADLGYVPRVDVQTLKGLVRRDWRLADHPWLYGTAAQLDAWQRRSLDGQTLDRVNQLMLSANAAAQTQASLWLMDRQGGFDGRLYSRSGIELALDSAPSAAWQFSLGTVQSGEIDRENAQAARQQQWRASTTWTPDNAWRLELSTLQRRLNSAGQTVSDEQASELRLHWHWHPQAWLRLTVQDRRLQRELARYRNPADWAASEHSRDWQLLLAWRPTAISTLHVGIGNAVDGAPDQRERQHQLFIKLSIGFDGHGQVF